MNLTVDALAQEWLEKARSVEEKTSAEDQRHANWDSAAATVTALRFCAADIRRLTAGQQGAGDNTDPQNPNTPPVVYAFTRPDGSLFRQGPYVLASDNEGQGLRLEHTREEHGATLVRYTYAGTWAEWHHSGRRGGFDGSGNRIPALSQKESPDFLAGCDAGLLDGKLQYAKPQQPKPADAPHDPRTNGSTEPCDAPNGAYACSCGAWHDKPAGAVPPPVALKEVEVYVDHGPSLREPRDELCTIDDAIRYAADCVAQSAQKADATLAHPNSPFGKWSASELDAIQAYGEAREAAAGGVPGDTFQARVAPWMAECFGAAIANDVRERGDRLLEEVLELLQSHGYDPARVATLRDYVFGRRAAPRLS